jgi:FkbM family methyltransferase
MRRGLKKILSEKRYQSLARFKRGVEVGVGRFVAFWLNLLPLSLQVAVREKWITVRPMDWPPGGILLHVESDAERRLRLKSCVKEPETVRWLENSLREGDTFFDIGANVGAYSLLADRIGRNRIAIYAFEPGFSTFPQLCRNILLNGAQDRISPLCVALSDRDGSDSFNYSDLSPGSASHSLWGALQMLDDPMRGMSPFRQRVPTFRLDELRRRFELDVPSLIKLDVDGFEFQILQGADETLSNARVRTILVEALSESAEEQQIASLLQGHGFQLQSRIRHGDGPGMPCNSIFVRLT